MRTTEDPVERKSGKYFYYDSPLYEETGFWIPVSVPPMLESDHDEWSKRFGSNGGYFPEEEFSWGQLSGEDKEMTIWDVIFEMLLMARGKVSAVSSGDLMSCKVPCMPTELLEETWKEMANTLPEANCGHEMVILETEPPRWLPDSAATACMLCNVHFHPIMRSRHHCRFCGGIFCNDCSKGRSLLPRKFRVADPQRVCNVCGIRLELVQAYLMNQIGHASQLPTHDLTDLSTLRSWLNFPWGRTMEYEIYKAANILRTYTKVGSLKPEKSIPEAILKQAKGLAILTVVCVGMIVTYKIGTGLVISRREDGSWSPPSAISSFGFGWRAQAGGELSDYIIILRNKAAIKTFSSHGHLSLGAGVSTAAGIFGWTAEADIRAVDGGYAACYTYSCNRVSSCTLETPLGMESPAVTSIGTSPNSKISLHRVASIGSCKHRIWEAIRASSAAPYYLDDFSDDVHRWQDGAIVANNPTIFAVREAQLLWPDTRIDCLVSIGCGSIPTKSRKGGWRYLDTGQVLIESACSVDRVEEALDALLPMIPEVQYFRFNPVDERYDMELDETDPAIWLKLEAATEEYIHKHSEMFKNVCEQLVSRNENEERMLERLNGQQYYKPKSSNQGLEESSPSLGWRRMVLLVESSYSTDIGNTDNHARSLEKFCASNGIRISLTNRTSGLLKPATRFATPFTSPLITGSFPSSPLYSPEFGPQRINRIDLVPPFSLDGHPIGKTSMSPPTSPLVSRQPSSHVRSLHEKLQNLPQVGIIHLALENDLTGSILSWQNDVFVVAEPGKLADGFLQSVKMGLSSLVRGRSRKEAYALTKLSSVADLITKWRCFQVGGIHHRYIGRQTQVMEDNQEISAFMFRRRVPAVHLTSEDVRWMVGAWRDRIVICTGRYGLAPSLVKAFLDSGAKAVVSTSVEPPDMHSIQFNGMNEYNGFENGKFEIGDEEEAEEDVVLEPGSSASDWEDSDAEKGGEHSFILNDVEEDLSEFICHLYDSLFREGSRVDVALQNALRSYPKLRYICHLPNLP